MTPFRKYLLFSFIFALINAVFLLTFFVSRFNHTDTAEYIGTIQYLRGEPEGEFFVYRFLKPLPLLIGAVLLPFLSAGTTLIFQNLIFYFLSVWLIFLLVCRLYHNEKQAFYGTILYGAAYPMLAYGLAPLTDLDGWFFYLWSVLIALNLSANTQLKTSFFSGLVAGLGMLFKENLGAAPIFFAGFVFIATPLALKEKIKHLVLYGAAFLLPVLMSSILIFQFYSYSYLDWYRHAWQAVGHSGYAYTFLRILIEGGRVFALGWLFFFLGVVKEFNAKSKERIKMLASFLLPSLSFFLWSFPHNRIMYIAFPLLVLLGSFGVLMNFKSRKTNLAVEIIILSLYVFLNYAVLDFLLRYGNIIQPAGNLLG